MAIAFQSAQSAVGTTSVVITKPASLAVGDLMVAAIDTEGNITSTPTEWTQIDEQFDGANATLHVYYVIATSTQTAASDFTWAGDGNVICGGISRISGDFHTSPVAVFAKDDSGSSTATPTFTISVTPVTVSSMLLFCVGASSGTNGHVTMSNYAVTTSNPSWTEAFDTGTEWASGNVNSVMAYATRPEVTATGDATVTLSGARFSAGIMLVVRPKVASTTTETEVVVDTLVKGVTKNILETESVVDTLTSTKRKVWNTTSKSSSSWTNQDKS